MSLTNNERLGREIQETIPCTIAPKRIKYPVINLPKETKDLYSENCKMLMKIDANSWKDTPCFWIERMKKHQRGKERKKKNMSPKTVSASSSDSSHFQKDPKGILGILLGISNMILKVKQ